MGLALLANAIATGCVLYVIITTLGPVSGPDFNPSVALAFALRGEIAPGRAAAFVLCQLLAAVLVMPVLRWLFAEEV